MKPLLSAVVAICLVIAAQAFPENIEQVKELSSKDIPLEEEESEPQTRTERCTTCTGGVQLKLKSPNEVLAALQTLPGGVVHTQSSFEGCSSDKGCAGIKVKDGRVLEKFGNLDAFRAAAEADTGNEFSFHASGSHGGGVFEAGIPKDGPFWWMNENSPFKSAGGAGGNFEKFSQSSSSSFSTAGGSGGANGGGAAFGANIDLSANPFLNGDFSKLGAAGFTSAGASQYGQETAFGKPPTNYQSSFESSSFTSSKGGEIDLSKNPFLNGGSKNYGGFQAQAQFGASAPQSFSGNKYSGYSGSSPSPFTAPTPGSSINLIQNSQKASEFDFEQQQQQQNIDESFQATGNVHAHEHEHAGGELQQTCAGQGYVCVHKAQCNNGVVNTNGAGVLQAKTKKQYCNIKSEICCRIEISTLQGGGGVQGSLGVGSATYSGSGSQGTGLFVSSGQAGQSGSSFGQSGSSFGSETSGRRGSGSFGQGSNGATGFGSTQTTGYESSSSTFNAAGSRGSGFGANGQGFGGNGQGSQGAQGSFGAGQSSFGVQGSFGSGSFGASGSAGSGNSGPTGAGSVKKFETSSSSFESSSRGTNFGAGTQGTKFGAGGAGTYSGSAGTGFGATGGSQSGSKFGATASSSGSKFGGSGYDNANEVLIKGTTTKTQTNFVETDSFSAGSETAGVYRPGAGSGLKPGIPYLPPIDNSNSGSSQVSSTSFTSTYGSTSPRPIYSTPKPYSPPSTSAPGYLPPQEGEQTINTETRVPPNRPPSYDEGQLILDETRQPNRPRTKQPTPATPLSPNEIPAGCAAALKCTPIEYCTAEGVISNTTVALTRDQDAYRVPLTDCKDIETGRVGKCCRDPYYSDPWPTNLIGKWAPGVFGGNDGKYTPDSRGSPNNPRPSVVTVRPPTTGSVYLNNFRTPKPTVGPTFGPNQVTPGFPSTTISQSTFGQKDTQEIRGQGQYVHGGQGQYTQTGQGSFTKGGQGSFTKGGQGQVGIGTQGAQGQFGAGSQSQFTQNAFTKTEGSYGTKGTTQFGQTGAGQQVTLGQGQIVTQGQGQYGQAGVGQFGAGLAVTQGGGQFGIGGGSGQLEIQEQGGQSQFTQTTKTERVQGQTVNQGQGQIVSQGIGAAINRGQGQIVTQGQGAQFTRGGGQIVTQGLGAQITGGQGQIVRQGQGQITTQSQGQFVSQGVGSGIRQGQGFSVSQGSGFGVENEFSESVQRVFLSRYSGSGQCGLLNGQKPYGNRNELEVDFAEIPWQAMVLLQTNRSLLCGGVITRPDVVVTSAACVEGLQAKNVLIKGGEWKLGIDDEPQPFQIVQVKNILRHPFYKSGSLLYDAAILVLTENLRLAKNIYPICLPGAQETLDGYYNGAGECMVTGWGKQVLQAHLAGSIMHSVNISLINPGECQAKLSQEYPHLLDLYDQESCACGQPTNPINNICKVDIGSALACTSGDGHFVLRGVYSWDSGCQPGNQLAAFYKFDLEWYEWAIGQIESTRFAQFGIGTQVTQNRYSGQINSGGIGIKGGQGQYTSGTKGGFTATASATATSGGRGQFGGYGGQFGQDRRQFGQDQAQFGQVQGQFDQFGLSKLAGSGAGLNFGATIKGSPIQNTFSASYSEKKVFQSEPQIISYTTKPEIVTFTTKPEIFTYTTKPKIVTYTTKPEIFTYTTKPKIVTYTTKPQFIAYETSGSGNNPQYVAPGVTFNPGFAEVVGQHHTHNAQCKCLEQGKK